MNLNERYNNNSRFKNKDMINFKESNAYINDGGFLKWKNDKDRWYRWKWRIKEYELNNRWIDVTRKVMMISIIIGALRWMQNGCHKLRYSVRFWTFMIFLLFKLMINEFSFFPKRLDRPKNNRLLKRPFVRAICNYFFLFIFLRCVITLIH